jgi:DNA-binding NarL/FixJ family response regulator
LGVRFGFGKDATPSSTHRIDALKGCEVEVLQLVARGNSNAEIAEGLFVGESTAKTHVSHILEKLGLRDRVQAVIVAYEGGVVVPGQVERALRGSSGSPSSATGH